MFLELVGDCGVSSLRGEEDGDCLAGSISSYLSPLHFPVLPESWWEWDDTAPKITFFLRCCAVLCMHACCHKGWVSTAIPLPAQNFSRGSGVQDLNCHYSISPLPSPPLNPVAGKRKNMQQQCSAPGLLKCMKAMDPARVHTDMWGALSFHGALSPGVSIPAAAHYLISLLLNSVRLLLLIPSFLLKLNRTTGEEREEQQQKRLPVLMCHSGLFTIA